MVSHQQKDQCSIWFHESESVTTVQHCYWTICGEGTPGQESLGLHSIIIWTWENFYMSCCKLDRVQGTDTLATRIPRPVTTWLLGFYPRLHLHTTNTTVLDRAMRPNLGCDCPSWCSIAKLHFGWISVLLRHLPCNSQSAHETLAGEPWSLSLHIPSYFIVVTSPFN